MREGGKGGFELREEVSGLDEFVKEVVMVGGGGEEKIPSCEGECEGC